ncbi:methyl-accepting chemotaxis protein [Haliovirga abyssi]|uniref:Methyl-accepting chemotaxis protein n=1 Tax=Haliovirga abyssi TaxID=2996794 RepID=A0AAU9D4H5_9FUSO|nr:methyl-accepting chemotaxis protein [Haliovirga abyssi]BDU49443.1 hypothetical protein HLVA_00120 [Haliovirga abyssi]
MKKRTNKKGTLSLKAKLILINSVIVFAILVASTITAINISGSKLGEVSDNIKDNLGKALNEKLKKAGEISINILKDKENVILREANIMGSNSDLITLVEYNMKRKTSKLSKNSFIPDEKNKKKFFVEYKKTKSILNYIRIVGDLQKSMYGDGAEKQIEIVDATGKVKAKTKGIKRAFREKSNSDKIKQILGTAGGLTLTDVIPSSNGLIIKAYGKIDKDSTDNQQKGILIVTLPLNVAFANQLKNMTDTEIGLYNGTKFFTGTLFGDNGKPLDLGDGSKILKKLETGEKIVIENKELDFGNVQGKNVKKSYRFAYIPITNYLGKIVGMMAVGVKTENLNKAISVSEKNKKEVKSEIVKSLVIVAIFGILIGMIFIYIYSGTITKEIKKILDAVNKVSEGNLTLEVKTKRKDEIGDLADGINNMTKNLKLMVYQITDMSERIASSTEQISATSEANRSSMEGIVNISGEIKDKSNEEMLRIQEAVEFISQINAGIKDISKYSEKVTEKSNDSSELAIEGGKAVKDAVDSINEIKSTVEETSEIVKSLRTKTEVVDKVVTVITGIADQTNLLALNAAIEAARAGEVGKGFAVVANEVKKLASQSAEAAEEIRTIILGIQSEANNVSKSMKKGLEEVEKGVNISNKAGEALKSIIDSVYDTTEMVTEITASTQEQSASSEEALKTMEDIAAASEQTNAISESIAKEAEERLKGVEEIVEGVNSILDGAETLNNLTDTFDIGKDFDMSENVKKELKELDD